jgi:hypothetical protein
MKFSKHFSQSIILILMMLLFIPAANGAYLIDTGPGMNKRSGSPIYNTTPVNGDFQFLAVEFYLDSTYTITDVEGWIYHYDAQNQASHITFIIYGDGGNIPDVNNELYNQVVTLSSDIAPRWHGLTNLNWSLSSGEYWLAFEVRQPELLDNAMPEFAPNPQEHEAYYNGGNVNFGYLPVSLGYGVRMQGHSINSLLIDIKPMSGTNEINLNSKGVIPVAIFSSNVFDATTINPLSVLFGPDAAEETHGTGHFEDVNEDGYIDLMLHFETRETGLICNDTEAVLTGETTDGQLFKGVDSIIAVGCK